MHELPEESLDFGGHQCTSGEQVKSSLLYVKFLTHFQILCFVYLPSWIKPGENNWKSQSPSMTSFIMNSQMIPSTDPEFLVYLEHTQHLKLKIQNNRESTTIFWCLSSLLQISHLSCDLFIFCKIYAIISLITSFQSS